MTAPGRLRGIVGIGGRVLPEFAPLAAPVAALSHLTLLIRHGLNDPVMPVTRGRATRDLFISLGVMLCQREYEAAHEVTDAMLTEAAGFLNTRINRLDQRIPPAG